MNRAEPLDLRDYVEVLSRRRRLVLYPAAILALLAALATTVLLLIEEPLYGSELEVLVDSRSAGAEDDGVALDQPDLVTHTYLIRSLPVTELVAEDLDLDDTPSDLRRLRQRISVQVVEGSNVLRLHTSHPSSDIAAQLGPSYVENYTDFQQSRIADRIRETRAVLEQRVSETEEQLAETRDELVEVENEILDALEPASGGIGGVDPSSVDTVEELLALLLLRQSGTESVSPSLSRRQRQLEDRELSLEEEVGEYQDRLASLTVSEEEFFSTTIVSPPTPPEVAGILAQGVTLGRNAILGAILGLALGAALAFGRDWQDRTLVRRRDAEAILDAPILASVTGGIAPGESPTELPYRIPGPHLEEYRALRALLRSRIPAAMGTPGGRASALPASILVVDPEARAVSSEVALNLAASFAEAGSSVLLVEIPGSDRGPSEWLGASESSQGIRDVLAGRAEVDAAALDTDTSGLRVVPTGGRDGSDGDVVNAARLRSFLENVDADLVVFECPPVSDTGDAEEIGLAVSGVLLTATWQRTSLDLLEAATTRLRSSSATVLGLVTYQPAPARLAGRSAARRATP